jgi:hypothetical protein
MVSSFLKEFEYAVAAISGAPFEFPLERCLKRGGVSPAGGIIA